jgi:hypothetical protein
MCWLTSIVNSRRNWGPKDSHPTGNLPSWGAHSAGTGWVRHRPGLTFIICQEITKPEHLGHKDANGDEELGYHPKSPPQIFRRQFP